MRVVLSPDAERRVLDLAEVAAAVSAAADAVVSQARRLAPKDTGAGAASIHAEPTGGGFRVSWDEDHFYMQYSELGSRRQPARPFLRPAAELVADDRG